MNKTINKDLKYASEDMIKQLLEESEGKITSANLQPLGELIDIYKDIANVEYWCEKEDSFDMYREYNDDYGRDYGRNYNRRGRDSYGRRERDSRGRYKGYERLDRMYDDYGRYTEDRDKYGNSEDTDKSFHYMVKSLEDFIKVLHEEAENEQQKQELRDTLQRSMM